MMKEFMQTRPDQIKKYRRMKILRLSFFSIILLAGTINAESQYLRRSLASISEASMELSTSSAHYFPMFGTGSDSSEIIRGLSRYGNLNIDPFGESKYVKYPDEELVVCVLDGTGFLNCSKDKIPVSMNDFMYIPAGKKFSLSNPRERKLSVIVMSFKIMPGNPVKPSSELMIASADEVPFQVLGSHGPTTTFQLLLGTTESTRDRLAAACQVTRIFNLPLKEKQLPLSEYWLTVKVNRAPLNLADFL